MKKMIYVCSPYKPVSYSSAAQKLELARNKALARYGCLTVVEKGGIPIAPHLFCTQFLDDGVPEERELGMDLGLEMLIRCDEVWVFKNGPFSLGMFKELSEASAADIPIKIFHVDDVSHIPNQDGDDEEEGYPSDDTDEEGDEAEEAEESKEETNDASEDDTFDKSSGEEEKSGLTEDMLENFLCALFGIGEEDKDEGEEALKKAAGRKDSNEDTAGDNDKGFEDELPIEAVEASLNALLEYLADHEKTDGHRRKGHTGHAGHPNIKSVKIVKI